MIRGRRLFAIVNGRRGLEYLLAVQSWIEVAAAIKLSDVLACTSTTGGYFWSH